MGKPASPNSVAWCTSPTYICITCGATVRKRSRNPVMAAALCVVLALMAWGSAESSRADSISGHHSESSIIGQLVWIGMLVYASYNFATHKDCQKCGSSQTVPEDSPRGKSILASRQPKP